MASEVVVRDAYKGKYHITHNPNARGRAPRYVVNDMKPKGVTTILGQTLAKDLMQWAVDCALDHLREKIPVVTEADLVRAGDEYKYRRDGGASTGSEAHAMMENFLKGTKYTDKASIEAVNAYNAFLAWFKQTPAEVLQVEHVIFSEQFEYAGTYDLMLKIEDKNYLCDLKTTNSSRKAPDGIYAEYFIQLGAYARAHHEEREYEIANGGTELPEVDDLMVISAKKNGVLDIVTASDLNLSVRRCGDLFEEVVDLYTFLNDTTKQLGGK